MFDKKTQFDVFTVLLLLGEASIWKSVWGRFRSRRTGADLRHWLFAVSPGWAPLAFTIFSTLNGSDGPPNMIFDHAPPEAMDAQLILTHLNSGASHPATNPVLQNIWSAWKKVPRRSQRERTSVDGYNRSKETGFVDVELQKLRIYNEVGLRVQSFCLVLQILVAVLVGTFAKSYGYEPTVALGVGFVGQLLLVAAVTPRAEAWDPIDASSKSACPVMLHTGFDSKSVLIIRSASHGGEQIVLEKFCGESMAVRTNHDFVQLVSAGFSCLCLVLHVVLVGWMSDQNKLLYFFTGLMGLLAHAIEGASEPNWSKAYQNAFEGINICSPRQSGLMAAVGVLVAGRFRAGADAAKSLYPSNQTFDRSRADLASLFDRALCTICRQKLNPRDDNMANHGWQPHPLCMNRPNPCVLNLVQQLNDTPLEETQIRDAICAVYHCIRPFMPAQTGHLPPTLASREANQIGLLQQHMTLWTPQNPQQTPPAAGQP